VESALSRGDNVIATARSLDKLKTTLGKETERLRFLQLDVTSGFEQIKKVASEATSIWGRIDVLMNNAGIGLLGITEESGWVPSIRLIKVLTTITS
jgi:NADP-dependent 3-hydroxy acid dehydrogenase YdfG